MKEENEKSNLQEKMNLSEPEEVKIKGKPTMSEEEAKKKLGLSSESDNK